MLYFLLYMWILCIILTIFLLFSIFQVRKQLRDMEAKMKDQEEELDEQAGTIQMLEQV